MPRIISATHNEIIFNDAVSGCKLGMQYRMPTTKERQGFLNMAVKRVGNKVTTHHAEARMAYGLKILTGLRDGDFMRMDSGQAVLISSNPSSSDYFPGWKEEIETGCADLVMALAGQVFDGGPSVVNPDDEDETEDAQGE